MHALEIKHRKHN